METTLTQRPVVYVTIACVGCMLLASCETTTPLHDAAIKGDVSQIDDCIRQGISVNAEDEDGNTPLHYAYYCGQKEAIQRLRAYGANPSIRNREGDTPMDMTKIATAENLLQSGSGLLDMNGSWVDYYKGQVIYGRLQRMEGSIVVKAIVRKVIRDENRLRILFLAIKLGINGSEERLNDVLHGYGDKSMAEDYINSGSTSLYEGGKQWADSHGYYISSGMGSHRVAWGRF